LLLLGIVPIATARRIVAVLRSQAARAIGFPAATWALFIVTLWAIHFSGFFEAALEHEPLHILEHALYLTTALLFWMPVIAIGPTPWIEGPLAFPIRMVYLLVAMPAEGFLGFAIYGSNRILYPAYARAGLADQQAAGELMWIGSGLAMFVAFMLVGLEWSRNDRARSLREDARDDRERYGEVGPTALISPM
jgi:putative copper resistance protein D